MERIAHRTFALSLIVGMVLGLANPILAQENAGLFDGLNDQVVVTDDPSLDLIGEFTIEAWIKLPSIQPAGVFTGSIVVKSTSQLDRDQNYALWVRKSNNRLGMIIGDGTNSDLVDGVTNLGTSTWVHVAGVRSVSALTLYVNGVFEAEVATTLTEAVNASSLLVGGQTCSGGAAFWPVK